ncbi:hypothetical protein F2Q69_00018140 [Brassica cretica]|uniref:DEAD/DEAH-box helicase domain-containing protein n=1 Tax=Brassica cretica TaxID=69181 RepID=A0A8S9QM47_BRACR|nr:hypothetical protein F2Q69_00018140 [Brassica cretica]
MRTVKALKSPTKLPGGGGSLSSAPPAKTPGRFSGSVTLSGGQDWKATLRVPPPDTRYQTGAFCIPVLEKIDPNTNVIQAMILVPMRELALQTSQVCKELSKYLNIQVMVTTGVCVLKDCTMLVMDEADKLLPAEFQADYPLDTHQQFTM